MTPKDVKGAIARIVDRLWVPHVLCNVGLPESFLLGAGGEMGEIHYRWRADEGVEYVVFEGGAVWFCGVAIDSRVDTWWQANSREAAKLSAYKDANFDPQAIYAQIIEPVLKAAQSSEAPPIGSPFEATNGDSGLKNPTPKGGDQ